jgi:hypothetical protein
MDGVDRYNTTLCHNVKHGWDLESTSQGLPRSSLAYVFEKQNVALLQTVPYL